MWAEHHLRSSTAEYRTIIEAGSETQRPRSRRNSRHRPDRQPVPGSNLPNNSITSLIYQTMRLCNPENIWRLLLRIPRTATFQRDAARRGVVAGRRRQTRPAPTLICLTYNSGRVQDISQLPICFMTLLKGLQHPRRFFHELGTIPNKMFWYRRRCLSCSGQEIHLYCCWQCLHGVQTA